MVKKQLTTTEVRFIGHELVKAWEDNKGDIKLPGKTLHALIGLKKKIEGELGIIEETIMGLAVQFGATPNADGSATIPEDKRKEAFDALGEFGKETIDIEYREIVISEEDNLPIAILEALYDFIQFKE